MQGGHQGHKVANTIKGLTSVWIDGHFVFLLQPRISVRSPSSRLASSCSDLLVRWKQILSVHPHCCASSSMSMAAMRGRNRTGEVGLEFSPIRSDMREDRDSIA